jgi:hypothetical protein
VWNFVESFQVLLQCCRLRAITVAVIRVLIISELIVVHERDPYPRMILSNADRNNVEKGRKIRRIGMDVKMYVIGTSDNRWCDVDRPGKVEFSLESYSAVSDKNEDEIQSAFLCFGKYSS